MSDIENYKDWWWSGGYSSLIVIRSALAAKGRNARFDSSRLYFPSNMSKLRQSSVIALIIYVEVLWFLFIVVIISVNSMIGVITCTEVI